MSWISSPSSIFWTFGREHICPHQTELPRAITCTGGLPVHGIVVTVVTTFSSTATPIGCIWTTTLLDIGAALNNLDFFNKNKDKNVYM
jgi:hypothetical protein